MTEKDLSTGVAVGIEFEFMGITFTGDLQHGNNVSVVIASAQEDADLRKLMAENDVYLPDELKNLPDLTVKTLYFSMSMDTDNKIEFLGSIKLEDVHLDGDLKSLGKTNLLTIDFDLVVMNGKPEVFLSLHGRPEITLLGEIKCNRFDLEFSYRAGGSWRLGGSTAIGIYEREILLSACYEEVKGKTRRFQLSADVSEDPVPLLAIPGVAELNPKKITLSVVKDAAVEGTSWNLSAVGDLKLYQIGDKKNPLFHLENGEIRIFDDKQEKEKGFKFLQEKAVLYPLSVFPDIPFDLKLLFVIGLDEIHIIHNDKKGWSFAAGLYLKLNNVFKDHNAATYDLINKVLFPKDCPEQQLRGWLNITSARGVEFVLENSFPLIIPSIFDVLEIPEELKALEEIKRLFDIGATYFCLERIEIAIYKEFSFAATLAVGLPSKLNNLIFGQNSVFNGLIKTYDEDDHDKANLLRAKLKVDAGGFSGSIEDGNIIDMKELDRIVDKLVKDSGIFNLKEGIEEQKDYISINFDALFQKDYTKGGPVEYGWIRIKKPELKLNTTSGAFRASGGYQVSEPLMLPIRPIFEKLFLLFQAVQGKNTGAPAFLGLIPNGIPIRNIDFFSDDKLNMDDLENWLKDCLPDEISELFAFPEPFTQAIEQGVGLVLNRLPEAFKTYLKIKFPTAFDFDVDITADGGVSFNIEVPDNKTEAESTEYGFSNCIQVLVPIPDAMGMVYRVAGIQLKKLAFGVAFGGSCLRLDLSGRVDMFDLVQLGASLLLEDKEQIKDETLRLMMPNRRKLGYHVMIDNLIMFIIYETVAPIPIPVYFRRLYLAYSGLEGLESAFFLGSKAGLSVSDFKRMFEVIGFFKDSEGVLTVDPYPYDETAGDAGIVFSAGPLYTRLPGFIGYEEVDGRKQNILLGTENTHHFNLLDLASLGANTIKFSVLNLIELAKGKKPGELSGIPVSLKDQEKEIYKKPINYLIEYLPVEKRMDFTRIKLFYLFDFHSAWAFTTPDEFEQVVYPRMLREYDKLGYPETRNPSSAGDLLQLFVDREGPVVRHEEDQGVVLFLRGGMYCAQEKVVLEGAIGISVSEHKGLRTGLSLKGKLLNWIDSTSFFFAKINPADKQEAVKVLGSTYLKVFERDVLMGLIEVTNTQLKLQGMLDAFPAAFPLQLKGFVKGELSPKLIDFKGQAGLQLGFFSASASLELHIDKKNQLFKSDLIFANSYWHFSVEHRKAAAQEWFKADLSANAFNLIALEGHLRFRRDIGRLQLLGTISLDFPQLNILYVKVDYAGEFNAAAGFLNLSARLSDNSYILSPNCRPTGGAAFCLWFDGSQSVGAASKPHAGDFVLTLGGYHPNFRVPSHYPRLPRLGIHWKIDRHTHIRGEAYFAMTPLAIMAGAKLELVYQNGNIRAWFTAYADFLCQWKPLYYNTKIGVSVGASYTLRVGVPVFGRFVGVTQTFSISIKALLHLWGPPTGGRVDIKLPIVTIGINFGKTHRPPQPLKDWPEFIKAFLDNKKKEAAGMILHIVPQSGVSAIMGPDETWIARADELSFSVTTKVPASRVSGNPEEDGKPVNIKPLNKKNITSTLTVKLVKTGKDLNVFEMKNIKGNVPAALWGKPGDNLMDNQNSLIKGAITGVRLFAKEASRDAHTLEISVKTLGYSDIAAEKGKKLPPVAANTTQDATKCETLETLDQAIKKTAQTRQAVLESLKDLGVFQPHDDQDIGYENLCRAMQTDWRHCPAIMESDT